MRLSALPKVSLVLSVYNMEVCLRETLDSVLSQSHQDIEVICINDGSTDGTLAILESYAEADSRVRIVSRENRGQGASRNEGIALATGGFLMLLDADDVYAPNLVESLLRGIMEADADIAVCRSAEMDHETGVVESSPWTVRVNQLPAQDPFSWEDMTDYIFTAFVGWPWDKMYRRSFVLENGLEFPALPNSEDLVFVFLSLVRARRITFIDEELVRHRVGRSGSVSNSRARAPFAFYDAGCLLKAELQKDVAQYDRLRWGFLNWFFDYTLWNIETMTDEDVKDEMARAFVGGCLSELEMDKHCKAYYSLDPFNIPRYYGVLQELMEEENEQVPRRHALLDSLISLLTSCRSQGYRFGLKRILAKLRLAKPPVIEQPLPPRGDNYFAFDYNPKEKMND